jgi:hypothetical protein
MRRNFNSGYISAQDKRSSKAGCYGMEKHILERMGGNFKAKVHAAAGVTRQSDLVGWWKSDENTGTTTADSTEDGGATLTLTNGATWATGKNGSALDFDGTNDYAVSGTGAVAETSAYSMSCWFNLDSISGNNSVLTQLTPSSGNHPTAMIVVRNNTVLCYHYNDNGGYTYAGNNATTISTGTWYNVIMTFSSSNGVKVYFNGSAVTINFSSGTAVDQKSGARTLYVAEGWLWGFFTDGKVDDIRYYGVELSSDNVTAIYNSGSGDWG